MPPQLVTKTESLMNNLGKIQKNRVSWSIPIKVMNVVVLKPFSMVLKLS